MRSRGRAAEKRAPGRGVRFVREPLRSRAAALSGGEQRIPHPTLIQPSFSPHLTFDPVPRLSLEAAYRMLEEVSVGRRANDVTTSRRHDVTGGDAASSNTRMPEEVSVGRCADDVTGDVTGDAAPHAMTLRCSAR